MHDDNKKLWEMKDVKKIISMIVCITMMLTLFAYSPIYADTSSVEKTVYKSDFSAKKDFSTGVVKDDPTGTGEKVLCLPYSGFGDRIKNNETLITPKVEGYEYYGTDSSSIGFSNSNLGMTSITFDLYVDKFNTEFNQVWRGVFGNEARFTAVNVTDEAGVTHKVYTKTSGSRWSNIGALSKSTDGGNTAYLLDSQSGQTNVKLQAKKWYRIKNVIDLKNYTQCMYISENGEAFKPVLFNNTSNTSKYADNYHTKITNMGYKDMNKCTYNTITINNNVYYTDTTCKYTSDNYADSFGTFQFMWITQKHSNDDTTYTPDKFTPATGSANHYVKNVNIISHKPIYEAVNSATSASEVEEYLNYYSNIGAVSLNENAEFKDKNTVYSELLNKNFTSSADVQAAYDKLLEKYNSNLIKEEYYNDFESGKNLNTAGASSLTADFTGDKSQTFYDYTDRNNNTILDLGTSYSSRIYHKLNENVNDGIIILQSQFFADWYTGKEDIEYNRYNVDSTSYGTHLALYGADGSSNVIGGLTRVGSMMGPNMSWGSPTLARNKWYDIRVTINTSNAVYGYGTMTIDYKKIEDSIWSKALIPQWTATSNDNKYIHIFDGTGQDPSTTKNVNNALLPSEISGIGFYGATATVDNLVDNVSVTVYNPLHEMIGKTQTADDVKNLLDIYKDFNSVNTNYESEYEVNYDAVYSALAGKTFDSDAALQQEFNRLCRINLDINDYKVEMVNTKTDGTKVFNVKSGDTINTKVMFTNNTENAVSVTAINALYDDNNAMIDLQIESKKADGLGQITEIPITTTIPSGKNVSKIKQFVLDSLDMLKPYSKIGTILCVPDDYTPTLYIIGDSLCQTYDTTIPTASTYGTIYPYQGWGYYMNEFLDGINVDNRAQSGWTTEHFVHPENKGVSQSKMYYTWNSFKDQIKPGDYVLVGLGINDSGSGNVSEERYIENLEVMYNDTVNAGATPLYSTPTIWGGSDGSESGWTYSISSGWGKRGEVCRQYAESKGTVCIPLGRTMSEAYEDMYQNYKAEHPEATVAEGRDYVRHYFHIFKSDLKSGKFGYEFTDEQISHHYGSVRNGDDATHVNLYGAQKLAEMICNLIKNSDCSLKSYVK